jgi:hypothetical protein
MTLSKRLDSMPPERRLYTLATLAQHLFDACQSARLALLFQDDGWMKARFASNDSTYIGFLSDLELAWQALLAGESAWQSDGGMIQNFAQHVRYGLLASSVISLASNIPPELVLRQVETGQWTTRRALGYIVQMETLPEQRAIAYALLLKSGRLSLGQQKESVRQGLGAAAAISQELERAQALIELAPSLSGDILPEALDLILEVQNDEWQAMTLAALSPQLTDPHLLDRALEAAWALSPTRKLTEFAAPRVIHGTRAEVAQERERALSSLIRIALWWPAVLSFSEQDPRGLVVSELAPQLDALQLAETFRRVRRIEDRASRAQILAALVPLLDHDVRNAILAEILDLAQDRSLLWLLAKSLPYFGAADMQQVWVLIKEFIQDPGILQEREPAIDRETAFETGLLPAQPVELGDLSQIGNLKESMDLKQLGYPDPVCRSDSRTGSGCERR